MFEMNGIQQGWQCPVCLRVYSPNTPMCYYCGKQAKVYTNAGTYNYGFDWSNAKSITVETILKSEPKEDT